MKNINRKKNIKMTKTLMSGLISTIFIFMSFQVMAAPGQKLEDKFNVSGNPDNITEQKISTPYSIVLDEAIKNGFTQYKGENIDLTTGMCNAAQSKIVQGYGQYEGSALVWDDKAESYEWNYEISERGLYTIKIDYYALESIGGIAPIRAIEIDNKTLFSEGYQINFYKMWNDSTTAKFNLNGDEINSQQEQLLGWQTIFLEDIKGFINEPLQIPLEKGKHTLRLLYEDGEVAIGKISFAAPEIIKSYEQVLDEYNKKDYKNSGDSIRFEAEDMSVKNDTSLRKSYDGDPSCTPFEYGKVRLNTISGNYWKKANQVATWKVFTTKAGLYKLNLRYLEFNGEGLNSYRTIKIDGKVPYKEFQNYCFTYDKQWQTGSLADSKNNPYLIYLDKGEHTVSMTVTLGDMAKIIKSIENLNNDMAVTIRNIIKVTGSEPDLNFHYELDKKIPDLLTNLSLLEKKILEISDSLKVLSNGKNTAVSSSFISIADGLQELISNPDIIPTRLNDVISNQESISQWFMSLQEQPISIDYLELLSPEKEVSVVKSKPWQMFYATYSNFIASFFKDYNNINLQNIQNEKKILNVWAARGREWSEIIQRMSDEDFSAKNDVAVKINLMPAGSMGVGGSSPLLLAITSGKTPDVVLGSDSQTPVELAIRGASYDLSKFENFKSIKTRFLDGAFTSLEYNNGVFALPDTQDFLVMFYRKDIFKELNLNPPKTWDELYRYVLPVLKQSNYDFYYSGGLYPYLFQEGGSPYDEKGQFSNLASNKGYTAFVKWVQNYTIYELPRSANFFIHFRVGDIPIGTGSFNDYVLFSVAAPELYGKWGIVPIPGTKKSDGTIDHSAGGGITTNFILNNTKNPQDSWKYLDWWTSTETQIKFGNDVESTIGVEARWNTANMEAFSRLPWNKEDLAVIQETHKWYKEVPVVAGGYMTGRQITNAWTRVVINDKNERDSLEKAVKDINMELLKKQQQYNLFDTEK